MASFEEATGLFFESRSPALHGAVRNARIWVRRSNSAEALAGLKTMYRTGFYVEVE